MATICSINLYVGDPLLAAAETSRPLELICAELSRGTYSQVPAALGVLRAALEILAPPPGTVVVVRDAPYEVAFGLDNMFKRRQRQWTTKSGKRIEHVTQWMEFCVWLQGRQLTLDVEYPRR